MKKLSFLRKKRYLFPLALTIGVLAGAIQSAVSAHDATVWVYNNHATILEVTDHPNGKRVDNIQPAAGGIQ